MFGICSSIILLRSAPLPIKQKNVIRIWKKNATIFRSMYSAILDNFHERMLKEAKIEIVWSFGKMEENASVSKR